MWFYICFYLSKMGGWRAIDSVQATSLFATVALPLFMSVGVSYKITLRTENYSSWLYEFEAKLEHYASYLQIT